MDCRSLTCRTLGLSPLQLRWTSTQLVRALAAVPPATTGPSLDFQLVDFVLVKLSTRALVVLRMAALWGPLTPWIFSACGLVAQIPVDLEGKNLLSYHWAQAFGLFPKPIWLWWLKLQWHPLWLLMADFRIAPYVPFLEPRFHSGQIRSVQELGLGWGPFPTFLLKNFLFLGQMEKEMLEGSCFHGILLVPRHLLWLPFMDFLRVPPGLVTVVWLSNCSLRWPKKWCSAPVAAASSKGISTNLRMGLMPFRSGDTMAGWRHNVWQRICGGVTSKPRARMPPRWIWCGSLRKRQCFVFKWAPWMFLRTTLRSMLTFTFLCGPWQSPAGLCLPSLIGPRWTWIAGNILALLIMVLVLLGVILMLFWHNGRIIGNPLFMVPFKINQMADCLLVVLAALNGPSPVDHLYFLQLPNPRGREKFTCTTIWFPWQCISGSNSWDACRATNMPPLPISRPWMRNATGFTFGKLSNELLALAQLLLSGGTIVTTRRLRPHPNCHLLHHRGLLRMRFSWTSSWTLSVSSDGIADRRASCCRQSMTRLAKRSLEIFGILDEGNWTFCGIPLVLRCLTSA